MNKQKEVVPCTSKFSIVREIAALLNCGDNGKLDSFFTRVVKTLKKESAGLVKNIEIEKFNHESALDDLKDELQDANEAYEEALKEVPVDQIATNAQQIVYMETYLTRLDTRSIAVKAISNRITIAKESHTEKIKELNEQIESLKTRIKVLSATK